MKPLNLPCDDCDAPCFFIFLAITHAQLAEPLRIVGAEKDVILRGETFTETAFQLHHGDSKPEPSDFDRLIPRQPNPLLPRITAELTRDIANALFANMDGTAPEIKIEVGASSPDEIITSATTSIVGISHPVGGEQLSTFTFFMELISALDISA